MNINIDGHTKLLALLGHPVAHSISPAMHSMAASILNLPYVYLAFDVEPGDLEKAVSALRTLGAGGFNLTMPLKKDIIPYLDRMSDTARLCNSVNTVRIEADGSLSGFTTDGRGLIRSLQEEGVYSKDASYTIIGAGGAARAIAAELALDGVSDIVLLKRKNSTFEDAKKYMDMLSGECSIRGGVCDMSSDTELGGRLAATDIIINATNVGMGSDDRSPIDSHLLDHDTFVCDIVYDPRETRLMKEANEAGCRSICGLGMLLYQGAESFRIWTGEEMPVSDIKKRLFP